MEYDKATLYSHKCDTFFIAYELDARSKDLNTTFALGDCLFGAVNLTKNADPDKYWFSGYGIAFDARLQFSLLTE